MSSIDHLPHAMARTELRAARTSSRAARAVEDCARPAQRVEPCDGHRPCRLGRRGARDAAVGARARASCRRTTGRSTAHGSSRRPTDDAIAPAGRRDRARLRDGAALALARTHRCPRRRAARSSCRQEWQSFEQLVGATAMRGFERGLLPRPLRGDFPRIRRRLSRAQRGAAGRGAPDRVAAPSRAQLALRPRQELGRRPDGHLSPRVATRRRAPVSDTSQRQSRSFHRAPGTSAARRFPGGRSSCEIVSALTRRRRATRPPRPPRATPAAPTERAGRP